MNEEFKDIIDKDMIYLVEYATMWDLNRCKDVLMQVATKKARLVAVYPGLGEKPPEKGVELGVIMDGALYLVKEK